MRAAALLSMVIPRLSRLLMCRAARVHSSCARQTEALGAEIARGAAGPATWCWSRGSSARARPRSCGAPHASWACASRSRARPSRSATATPPTALTVSHLDLYRIASLQAEDPDLLADYLGEGRIAFVEWPEDGARGAGDGARLVVRISHRGEDDREVELEDRREPSLDRARTRHGHRGHGGRPAAGRRERARTP